MIGCHSDGRWKSTSTTLLGPNTVICSMINKKHETPKLEATTEFFTDKFPQDRHLPLHTLHWSRHFVDNILWSTSTLLKYDFRRIYTGAKQLANYVYLAIYSRPWLIVRPIWTLYNALNLRYFIYDFLHSSVLWHCWLELGRQEESIWTVKHWVMKCWCGYLSG